MKLLLDTDALLWSLTGSERLSAAAREAIRDGGNEVHVSIASPWELSIKASIGKLPRIDNLESHLEAARLSLLPISLRHTEAVGSLPFHHRDPFDRILIAQAQVEGMTLISADRQMRRYPVALLSAT